MAVYKSVDLNMFLRVDFLEKILVAKNSARLFKYRIKSKGRDEESRNLHGLESRTDKIRIPKVFNFEINVMNLFQFSQNFGLLLRMVKEPIVYNREGEDLREGTLMYCGEVLKKRAG